MLKLAATRISIAVPLINYSCHFFSFAYTFEQPMKILEFKTITENGKVFGQKTGFHH
jgi:hypothetical protein